MSQQEGIYTEAFVLKAKELAQIGRIPIYDKFDDRMKLVVSELIFIAANSLHPQNKKWVTLHINSRGGDAGVCSGIQAIMAESGLKFRGLVEYDALSAGFNLLQFCNWRVAVSGANLLFHYGSVKNLTLGNEEQSRNFHGMKSFMNFKKSAFERDLEAISNRCGISSKKLIKLADSNLPIIAEKALKWGLLDEVISHPKSEKPPEGYGF